MKLVKHLLSLFFAADFLTWTFDCCALHLAIQEVLVESFKYVGLCFFFSFFLFLIWQQRLLFLMTIHLDLSQRLSVSNCWFFFFSSDKNAPKHFFPTADMLKHFWRHWICRALLSFPFLANPGYNMTVELQFLSTCVSWIWSSATLEMSGVSKLVWITNVFHAHLWGDETIASFLLST